MMLQEQYQLRSTYLRRNFHILIVEETWCSAADQSLGDN